MEPSRNQKSDKIRDDKIKLMQARQKLFMEQRSKGSSIDDRSLPRTQSNTITRLSQDKKKPENARTTSQKQNEVLLWTSKNPECPPATFVVRNKSKKTSARSDRSDRSLKLNTKSKLEDVPYNDSLQWKTSSETQKSIKTKYDQRANTPEKLSNDNILMRRNSDDFSSVSSSITDGVLMKNIDYDKSKYCTKTFQKEISSNMKSLRVSEEKPNQSFSMHCCSICEKLMDRTSNFPYLIIPCGHNICAQCLPKRTDCPICHSQILSTIENKILAEVIVKHQKQQKQEELNRKEEEARKFVDEYDTLSTRYDVMKGRAEEVIQNMEEITSKLMKKKEDMEQIQFNGSEIKGQIKSLQEKLEQCEQDYQINRAESEELELIYEKEKGNLDMLEQTLHQINASRERVKLLIQSFVPSFEFENSTS